VTGKEKKERGQEEEREGEREQGWVDRKVPLRDGRVERGEPSPRKATPRSQLCTQRK
jgi:hypothetical protein